MRRAPVTIAVIACLSGVACGPDLPDRLWRSDDVRYFSRADDQSVCPAILDELEQHGQVIADALMIGRTPVTYYRFNGPDDFSQHAECGPRAAACAPNATVRSAVDFDRHELIHAYLSPYGRPPWLLAEGAAVALSCQAYPRPTGSWRDAYALDHDDPALYAAGGWLVGYLLKMFPARLLPYFYNRVAINATADEFAQAFEDVYCNDLPAAGIWTQLRLGSSNCISLDKVWTAAIGGPTQPMRCPWECGNRPAFAIDGQPHALTPACSGGSLQLSVDVPNAGLSRWRIDGDGWFALQACDGSDAPQAVVSTGARAGALIAPVAGQKYFIAAGGTATLSASVTQGEGVSWSDCAAAPILPDDLSPLSTLALFYPSSATPQFTSLALGTSRAGQLSVWSEEPSASISVCASCDALTCATADTAHALQTQAMAAGTVISVPAGPAVTASFFWP